jgi:ABC-type cobalamin/Fe3+-siderophores transport system ATPase subunit
LELTSISKAIHFADDLIILTRGEIVAEAENYMNLELTKLQEWLKIKIKFNENESKVMLTSRRKRIEKRRSTFTLRTKHLNKSNALGTLG